MLLLVHVHSVITANMMAGRRGSQAWPAPSELADGRLDAPVPQPALLLTLRTARGTSDMSGADAPDISDVGHAARHRGCFSPGFSVHRILVPADVKPIAPSGLQNAPGCTIGPPPPPAGGVVFGAGGFVVVLVAAGVACFVVALGVGTAGGASVGTAPVAVGDGGDAGADADSEADSEVDSGDGDGDGDGLGESAADGDGD
ncbi:hypothetical protein [Dactylosporangium sp. NPDC051484]|uniref:hypothetical protein n=1 Tax=Dactylosporangium sp. NPDC051484 TaxID=3154942 RepID=UPI00344CC98D